MTERDEVVEPDASTELVAPPTVTGGRLTTLAQRVEARGVGVSEPPDFDDPGSDGGSGGGGAFGSALRLGLLLAGFVALGIWRPWILVTVMAVVVMIFFHELGHYVMAKRAGMKVTEFFLFFGPTVWSFRRGETVYGIKSIPAGAYVKIVGMTNLEEVDPADEARTYRQKSFRQRLGVAVAGSAMHFVMALVLIFVSLVFVGQPAGSLDPREQERNWRIEAVTEGSGADQAGLQAGDKILTIDGKDVVEFSDLREIGEPLKGETVPVTFERDGRTESTDLTLEPFYLWWIDRVPEGSPADESDLEVGDDLISIDGRPVGEISDMTAVLDELGGQTVDVTFHRSLDDGMVQVMEGDLEVRSLILRGNEVLFGVSSDFGPDEKVGVGEAVVRTPRDFTAIMGMSLQGLGKFFTPGGIADFAGQVRDARADNLAANPTSTESSAVLGAGKQVSENRLLSIFGLVRLGGDAGAVDPTALITLFAMINIFIGVFNLVPLLPFDGGHVVVAAYEKIQERRTGRRRYFTDAAKLLPVTYVVVALLALLFISTLYLDIANPIRT